MSATEAAEDAAIRPFEVGLPDSDLAELRRRISATRWPERETVGDDSQGVPLETIEELARYWGTDYDWSKCETKLNALPNFELHHGNRWPRHSFHTRSLPVRGRAAADRHARMARVDH